MADHEELVPQTDSAVLTYRSEQEELRRRVEENRERLRLAVEQVRDAARELTPAGRIRSQPYIWVLGGFAVGLALGWLMSSASTPSAGRTD